MLPATHRLTSPAQFREVVRRGSRSGGPLLVVHLRPVPGDSSPPRAGLVVSKAVGKAVIRTRVKRRLRHLLREHLDLLPPGSLVVVRAQPAAADADYAELGEELERSLRRGLGRAAAQVPA